MDKDLKKIENRYWKISKLISVLFLIIEYKIWTNEPYSIIKGILLLIGVSVATFIVINIIDLLIGVILGVIRKIHKHFKDKRILKQFYKNGTVEE